MKKKQDSSSNKNPTPVSVVPSQTEAQKIWNELKDRPIEMFALPNQTVSNYVTPINIEPSKLYLAYKVSAVIPSLEASAGPSYTVERMDKYIVVSRVTNLVVKK